MLPGSNFYVNFAIFFFFFLGIGCSTAGIGCTKYKGGDSKSCMYDKKWSLYQSLLNSSVKNNAEIMGGNFYCLSKNCFCGCQALNLYGNSKVCDF